MSDIKNIWSSLSRVSRFGLALGTFVILAGALYFVLQLSRPEQGVLFKDLEAEDGASIVKGLKELKVDYQLEDNGRTVLVDKSQVSEVRLSLMGEGVSLNNSVGLELFDNADYGMTEFTQKVTYQRALQGELARTIMALEEIQFARVHLTLAKSNIFRKDSNKAKASITIVSNTGYELSRLQVNGIQNLVASSVEGLEAVDVVIIDERGINIARNEEVLDSTSGFAGTSLLDKKQNYERHLQLKIENLLGKAFGTSRFAVSVNVDFDLSKTTLLSENLIAPKNESNGFVKQSKENTKFANAGSVKKIKSGDKLSQDKTVEYVYGKEVKQTEFFSGGIKKVDVAVIIPSDIGATSLDELKNMIAAAAGLIIERGDRVEVQRSQFYDSPHSLTAPYPIQGPPKDLLQEQRQNTTQGILQSSSLATISVSEAHLPVKTVQTFVEENLNSVILGIVILLLALLAILRTRRKRQISDRERLLKELQAWIQEDAGQLKVVASNA